MRSVTVKAYAKINLSLDVISKMDDGMHAISTIMQTVTLSDDLTVTLTGDGLFSAKSGLKYLPSDERNLAARAARLFAEHVGLDGAGVLVELEKHIPVCAGLGGGSSDAAAVLRAMNVLTGAGMTPAELEKLGEKIGSDVPFCVAGGTAHATGKGEILKELPPLPACHIVICKPGFSVSTPELFSRLDCAGIRCRPDTAGMLNALEAGELKGVARRVFNVFEEELPRGRSEIAGLRGRLLDNGALGVAMSGTGSSVFGIFEDEREASRARDEVAGVVKECFLCRPMGKISWESDD